MKDMTNTILTWLLDERIILLVGALLFTVLGMVLISWNASESYVILVLGLASGLVGALIRGIVGPNGDNK